MNELESSGAQIENRSENPQTPLFDAGAFTITHADPNGFELKIDHNLRRRNPEENLPLNAEERELLKDHLKGNSEKGIGSEIDFVKNKARKKALEENREPTTQDYTDQFVPNVGIRNIHEELTNDGKTILHIDTKPVTFKVYSELVNRENADRKDLLNFGESTGTAAAIFTKDEKLIIQYRGKANRSYGNIPGASAAGMLNARFNRDTVTDDRGRVHNINRGVLADVNPLVNINKEISEELQVDPNDASIKLVGIAHDEVKPHSELMYVATIDKTSNELSEKGLIPDDMDGHDFKERYFTIDGTPEAIRTLLTQVKCPLPPTHSSAFFMAGFMKVAERDGAEAASRWAQEVSSEIKANYDEIDRFVIENYDNFPSQINGKNMRSRKGYDPAYLPEEQGLPSLLDELVRTQLISEPMYWKLKEKYDSK